MSKRKKIYKRKKIPGAFDARFARPKPPVSENKKTKRKEKKKMIILVLSDEHLRESIRTMGVTLTGDCQYQSHLMWVNE